MTRIAVIGLGNVGLANAVLLARRYSVVAMDIQTERVSMVNSRSYPGVETLLSDALDGSGLDLRATTSFADAVRDAEYVLIATQTDLDPETNKLDTNAIEATIKATLTADPNTVVVIRSTIPVGFVEKCRVEFNSDRIIFCPEFLRQDHAYFDCLHPSRIVVGDRSEKGAKFARLLADCCEGKEVPILLTNTSEAEAVKLFSNSYLAIRVAFFNELDSFAMSHGIDTAQIISGVSLDPRIGKHYNAPSFGYGGNCLPKDTKQLLTDFANIHHALMEAVVASNQSRTDFLVESILSLEPNIVGIYRPETSGDTWSNSAELGIIRGLMNQGVSVVLYELPAGGSNTHQARIIRDLATFKAESDMILCDRYAPELHDVAHKIWTRDINFPRGSGVS